MFYRISFLVALLLPSSVYSDTFYVAKTGRDTNSCSQAQSTSTPKLTIKAGMACLSPGDTLVIRAGTYTEFVAPYTIPSGISDARRTIVRSQPGETVIVKGVNTGSLAGDTWTIFDRSYITIDGIHMGGGRLRIGASRATAIASYITVQNGKNYRTVGSVSAPITHQGYDGNPTNIHH
jgi:hypothetical protein